ncbi:hypothetical protein FWF93_02785 [Candidatus Saccharibacteria bacterium]|jgi:hypothetical protein|nr:hypothetical protein [Candidatus Saccharibacteria bacterium]
MYSQELADEISDRNYIIANNNQIVWINNLRIQEINALILTVANADHNVSFFQKLKRLFLGLKPQQYKFGKLEELEELKELDDPDDQQDPLDEELQDALFEQYGTKPNRRKSQ